MATFADACERHAHLVGGHVFCFLSVHEMSRVACVSAACRICCDDELLWEAFIARQTFPHVTNGFGKVRGARILEAWRSLDVDALSVKRLKEELEVRRICFAACVEKADLRATLHRAADDTDLIPAVGRSVAAGSANRGGGGGGRQCMFKSLFYTCVFAARAARESFFASDVEARVDRLFLGRNEHWDNGWTERCLVFSERSIYIYADQEKKQLMVRFTTPSPPPACLVASTLTCRTACMAVRTCEPGG
jgi:hypothetical protein